MTGMLKWRNQTARSESDLDYIVVAKLHKIYEK
jgi:hypothetical protein